MSARQPTSKFPWLAWLVAIVVWKVTFDVLGDYRHYLPPDFSTDFLRGREQYFFGAYQWAFHAHLVSGPASLLLGTILISERHRAAFPNLHRRVGRAQVACVLLGVVPSGLWMSHYALTGAAAGVGLATLAIATALCICLGWRAAVQRQFATHRRWMWRTYLLLCSAVVIRLIGGLATVMEWEALWIYPASAWASWLVPLLVYEMGWNRERSAARSVAANA